MSMRSDVVARDELLGHYRTMTRIRHFEQAAARLYRDGEIPGFCHLSLGQEAVATGVCARLGDGDVITSTHRGHGHVLAKGADLTAMLAELMGREGGLCRGRGGSMHVADPGLGIYGANGIVAAGLPIAVGAAVGSRVLGVDRVVVAFFGDGSVSQGAFHEAVNLAALWRLSVVFVCENNHYAEFSRSDQQQPVAVPQRAAAFGIRALTVDGNDIAAVLEATDVALAHVRAGEGPILLEADTYRWSGHYEGDPMTYRAAGELEEQQARDPLIVVRRDADDDLAAAFDAIDATVDGEVSAALETARASPAPDPVHLDRFVLRDRPQCVELPMTEETIRYVDGLTTALRDAMDDDPTVFLAGIDIGASGGAFRVTAGLLEQFGPGRVLDTPISETAILGAGVGSAMAGARPVVELMFNDFIGVCLDQLMNQAAKLPFMTGGAARMSLVVRTQYGAGRSSGAQHSQSLEGLLASVPGLTVVVPSTPADAYGLLRAAIEDPNPVVVFEHRHLYGRRGPAPHPGHRVPVGRARIVRPGRTATVVSWGRMVHLATEVAERLAPDGIDVEVIDLRTISPWDRETVLESVARTTRLAIVHEATGPFGPGAEIAAVVADEGVWSLDAPIRRIAPPAVPAPYAPALEAAWLPDADRVERELRALVRA